MNSFQFRLIIIELIMVKRIYRTETVQVYLYKIKKPLKIKRLTTVIVHSIDLFSNQNINLFKKLASQDS